MKPIKRAIISVYDKSGLLEFAQFLSHHGVDILATGGTAAFLRKHKVKAREISDYTGFPEIMNGRVKTLHPKIHGGLLADRDDASHARALKVHDIAPVDLVVINLYPFEKTVASGADYKTCVENVDIGGPAMLRSAAKNHKHVTVVMDPADYVVVMAEMRENNGSTSFQLRQRLALAAFSRTSAYDAVISNWLSGEAGQDFPRYAAFGGKLRQTLRYGENPHQKGAYYAPMIEHDSLAPGVATAKQLMGKELSYNNLADTDAAFELVAEFEKHPAVAIIKHANPCGVAESDTLAEAYRRALACDPVSAFGSIVALNRPLDAQTAQEIIKIFTEVVIAPDITEEARDILAQKKSLRVLVTGGMPNPAAEGMRIKPLAHGFLMQSRDFGRISPAELKQVTARTPTEDELRDLMFAFRVVKHVRSNAVIYVKDGATVGIGAGQMSRVDASKIAVRKAKEAAQAAGMTQPLTNGAVVASDAFFPFADGLEEAANAGATAVIQPGGSIRDDEVIKAANDHNMTMVFTGMRHFKH